MYYLRDIEEALDEYRRQAAPPALDGRDLMILEKIQRQESTSVRKQLANALVQIGLKIDPQASSAANRAA